jgi:hypothetical protein
MMIAVRYGYMPKHKYNLIYKHQSYKYVVDDILYSGWLSPDFKSVEREINSSMKRFNIEEDDFYFQFLVPISTDFHLKLSKDKYYEDEGIKMKNAIDLYRSQKSAFANKIVPIDKKLNSTHVYVSSLSNMHINPRDIEKEDIKSNKSTDLMRNRSSNKRKSTINTESDILPELDNLEMNSGRNLLREISIMDQINTPVYHHTLILIITKLTITLVIMSIDYENTLKWSINKWIIFG